MEVATRSKTDVYLLGSTKEALLGTKLPSIGDVLRVYLHHLKTENVKHAAAVLTLNEVQTFWERARIPMRRIDNAIKQFEELVRKWEGLKKNKGRRTSTQIANEAEFTCSFDDLFDVAHDDALQMITIPEDGAF